MWRVKPAVTYVHVFTVLFAALYGIANCQSEPAAVVTSIITYVLCSPFSSITAAFTLHPRNVTTLYDRTVEFTCGYTRANSEPQWLIVAEGGAFGFTQTLNYRDNLGLYSYHTATPFQAQVSVRALKNTPGLNNTCFSCRFITAGLVESGRGCVIIACELRIIFIHIHVSYV